MFAAGTLLNQVEEQYNGLGQRTGEWQSHGGAVNTNNPPQVQYVYQGLTGASSDGRITAMIYPNQRQLDFVYNSGLDGNISRISALSDHARTGAGTLESYGYLGLDTIVVRGRPQASSQLTYVPTNTPGGDGGDKYSGLDRFGRIVDQYWQNTGTLAATDRLQSGYDADGNVLFTSNLVSPVNSELYHANGSGSGYDALNRLTTFQRGTLNGTNDSIVGSASKTQGWTLDAVGNWTAFNSSDTTNQTRTFNARNEIATITGGNAAATPTFDSNGNMTQDETGKKYVYDSWNRITKVEDAGGNVLESYSYDALGRRIVEAPTGQTARDLYFDGSNVIEEQQAGVTTAQYVWGVGYVNDLVLRDDNWTGGSYGKSGSGLGRRLFVQQDANFNVTSLVNTSGQVLERFLFDPYGKATVVDAGTWVPITDQASWTYTFQGGRQDPISGLIHFGARDYSTTLGRWAQADPLGAAAGPNVYQAMEGSPAALRDPTGMEPEEDVDEIEAEIEREEEMQREQETWEAMHSETPQEEAQRLKEETQREYDQEMADQQHHDEEMDRESKIYSDGATPETTKGMSPEEAEKARILDDMLHGRIKPDTAMDRLNNQKSGNGDTGGDEMPSPEQPADDLNGDPCPTKPHYLRRPYLRRDTVRKIVDDAKKDADGRFIDPNTRQPIIPKPDIGHKPGHEFWRERDQAERERLTQQQFNDRMNDPTKYQLEDPSQNRSHRYELP